MMEHQRPARKIEAAPTPPMAVCPDDRFVLIRDEWLTSWEALAQAAPRTQATERRPQGMRSWRGQAPALAAFIHCVLQGAGDDGVWTDRAVPCSAARLSAALPWSARTFERFEAKRYFHALVDVEHGQARPKRPARIQFHMVPAAVMLKLLEECGADHSDRGEGDVLAGGAVLKVWTYVVRVLGGAARDGRPAAEVPLRQLAARAKVSLQTARNALLWLRVAGLIDDNRPASKGLSQHEPQGPGDSGWRYPVREIYPGSSAMAPVQVAPPRAAFALSRACQALADAAGAVDAALVENTQGVGGEVEQAVDNRGNAGGAAGSTTDKIRPSKADRSLGSETSSPEPPPPTQPRAQAREAGRGVESPAPPAQGRSLRSLPAAPPPSGGGDGAPVCPSPVSAEAAAGDAKQPRRARLLEKKGVDRLAGRLVEALSKPGADALTPLRGRPLDAWKARTIARHCGSWDGLVAICEAERLALTHATDPAAWLAKTLQLRAAAGELPAAGEPYTPSRTQERLAAQAVSSVEDMRAIEGPARAATHEAARREAVTGAAVGRVVDPGAARARRLAEQVHELVRRAAGWARDGRGPEWPARERARALRDVLAWDREARGLGLDEAAAELLAEEVAELQRELAYLAPEPTAVRPPAAPVEAVEVELDAEHAARRAAMHRALTTPRIGPVVVEAVPVGTIDEAERQRRVAAMNAALAAWTPTHVPRPRR
jgi:hypothetical protein